MTQVGVLACGAERQEQRPDPAASDIPAKGAPGDPQAQTPAQAEMPLWRAGKARGPVTATQVRAEALYTLDLGEAWTPYLFTDAAQPSPDVRPHVYRKTFLALARGEHPKNHHGARARRDKYLELYGIPPTLHVLRQRMHAMQDKRCTPVEDLAAVARFSGTDAYRGNARAQSRQRRYRILKKAVNRLLRKKKVADVEA
ncbi:MAG: hypothetical protein ACPGUV_13590, partial [Polyangiales bacterium]